MVFICKSGVMRQWACTALFVARTYHCLVLGRCCRSANYKITGVGVEDLEVSFPWTAYLGHHEGEAASSN